MEYYEILIIVRDVFLTLNSAINIFIYTCLDKTFRRVLRKFFRRLLRKPANYSVDRVDVALEMEQCGPFDLFFHFRSDIHHIQTVP